MDHALLVSFLEGETSPQDFTRDIKREVDACEEGFRSPTNVGYVDIKAGPLTTVTRTHLKRFLQHMLDGGIPWMAANYTGDCLIMSDDFEPEDKTVAEAIQFIADDSRPPTADETREALEALG